MGLNIKAHCLLGMLYPYTYLCTRAHTHARARVCIPVLLNQWSLNDDNWLFLCQIFSPYGRVEDVYLMRDEMKQSRGLSCCFISFIE